MHSRNLTVLMVVLVLVMGAILAVGAQPASAEPDVTLVEYALNPVYDPPNTADEAYFPCVLYDANKFSSGGDAYYYKMWYADGQGQVQAVTYSNDGINWTNPVQTTGIVSAGYHAQVLYIPGGYSATGVTYFYKTWYWNPTSLYTIGAIRTADSTDGVVWANDKAITQNAAAELVVVSNDGTIWNRGSYGPVSVHYNPAASNTGANPFDYTFAMYYDGTTGGMESIGLGYSADGNTDWRIYGAGPVLDHGVQGNWDSNYATAGTVIRGDDGTWRMWYSGGVSRSNEGIGYATSTNGLSWTKDGNNPVFHKSDGVAWRNERCYTPSVLYSPTRFDGHGDFCSYKMWFTGETSAIPKNRTIGYAASKTDPIPITVTADAKIKTYGDADPDLTYSCDTEGVAFEGSPGRAPGGDVGEYAINQGDLSAGSNYSITFVGANLTINKKDASVTPTGASKIYGEADPELTGDLTGFLAGDNVTATYSRVAGEAVGMYMISATLAPTGVLGNYNLTYNHTKLTINKKDASVTPKDASKIYGEADPELTGVPGGFLPGDNVTATYTRAVGETVGTYEISAALAPAGVLGNYDITYNTADFTINKKSASVTPTAASKTYGAPDPTLTGVPGGFLPGDNVTATYTRAVGETVGTYAISAALAPEDVLGNYDITYNTAVFTITKANTTVGLTSSTNPACFLLGLLGCKVTFTATVSTVAPGAGIPGGTVTFYDGTKKLGTGTLANGKATYSISPFSLCLGKHCITAVYSGSTNFNGSTSPVLTQYVW